VTSIINALAGSRASASSRRTISATFPAISCRGETLTETTSDGERRRHDAACRHASPITHSPSSLIAPVSSASGMNSAGPTSPRVGWSQRRSASQPTMEPVASEAKGW